MHLVFSSQFLRNLEQRIPLGGLPHENSLPQLQGSGNPSQKICPETIDFPASTRHYNSTRNHDRLHIYLCYPHLTTPRLDLPRTRLNQPIGGPGYRMMHKIYQNPKFLGAQLLLGIDIFVEGLGKEFKILNIHGPYLDILPFWETLLKLKLLKAENLILGSDLNFSLGEAETWGPIACPYPLTT